MDKKTTITVGRSVQVFQIGQPEYWNKFTISREFSEDVNIQKAIDDLVLEIDQAHNKHSVNDEVNVGAPVSKKQPSKLKPDLQIRKEYTLALAREDMKKIELLEAVYDFNIG